MAREIKGARKRRLPRLPSATLLDAMLPGDGIPTQKWEPTEEHWRAMAKACGLPFDAADREEIGVLVASYFEAEPFEPSAPFVADFKKYLVKLQREADGFYQALLSSDELENETLERNAAIQAGILISLRLEKIHCALTSIDDFQKAMDGFLTAVAIELNKVKGDAKGFVEGESWRKLIRGLGRWFKSKGLRVTASKGGIGKPSAFVAFMLELQSTFPERFKRHHHSVGALAKAISAVLAGR